MNIDKLTSARKILREELSNSIKENNKEYISRLCDVIGRLEVLIKVTNDRSKR